MGRPDQLDSALAVRFAWCFALPGRKVDLGDRLREPSTVLTASLRPLEAMSPGELERSDERMRNACRALAVEIGHAWELSDSEASAAATKRLVSRADRMGGDLVGMSAHPIQVMRLIRLFLRHGPTMTVRQRERAAMLAGVLPRDGASSEDLVVDVALAGDRVLAEAFLSEISEHEETPEWTQSGSIGARLASVLDAAVSDAPKAVAIQFLGHVESRSVAVPALRRALGVPAFGVRARALYVLATQEPCGVTEGELAKVLTDLVTHPLPDLLADEGREEDERIFAEAVVAALSSVRPAQAEEALLDLIDAEQDTIGSTPPGPPRRWRRRSPGPRRRWSTTG